MVSAIQINDLYTEKGEEAFKAQGGGLLHTEKMVASVEKNTK